MRPDVALIGTAAVVASECGGGSTSVETSVAQRVDVGATEDAYAGARGVAVDGGTVWATKPNESELIRIDAASGGRLAERPDQDAAGNHESRACDEACVDVLRSAQCEPREQHAPERLRGDNRRDD